LRKPSSGGVISVQKGIAQRQSRRLCLFSTYDRDGVVDPWVIHHVRSIRELGFDVVLISTSHKVRSADLKHLQQMCRLVVHRRNLGFDFLSWKVGIELTDGCSGYDRLLLINDSMFGPFSDLRPIFERFEASSAAFCGLTESYEYERHLQSYFLYCKLDELPKDTWKRFWAGVRPIDDKQEFIRAYEVGLSQQLIKAGAEVFAYVAAHEARSAAIALGNNFQYADRLDRDAYNATWFMWDILLTKFEFPYLKRVIAERDPLQSRRLHEWRQLVAESAQATVVPLIDNFLWRMRNPPIRVLIKRAFQWYSIRTRRAVSRLSLT
jgi:lipopolysaccharide biosynthesis protein